MKVKHLTNEQFAKLADDCGITILKKLAFDLNTKRFVFDEYMIDGDFAALRQFAEQVATLELHDV
jgi:hypothetical protein